MVDRLIDIHRAPAPASAPDFSQAAPAPGIFFRAVLAPRGQKNPAPAPENWLSLAKFCFPRKLVR